MAIPLTVAVRLHLLIVVDPLVEAVEAGQRKRKVTLIFETDLSLCKLL